MGCEIGHHSVVAAGAVVPQHTVGASVERPPRRPRGCTKGRLTSWPRSPVTRPKADRQRILQAPLEIAGQAALTAAALRAIGHDSKAFLTPHPYSYAVGGDYRVSANPTIQKLQRIAIAPWMLARYDVFHFHNGTSLVPAFRVRGCPYRQAAGSQGGGGVLGHRHSRARGRVAPEPVLRAR